MEQVTFQEFAKRYCERQEQTPEGLAEVLREKNTLFKPVGWMLLQCIVLDSSRIGQYTILPYGGGATLQEVPSRPFSPRGLASDISEVVCFIPAEEVP